MINEIHMHVQPSWRRLPWRWVKIVNLRNDRTAHTLPWPQWCVHRALDKVCDD